MNKSCGAGRRLSVTSATGLASFSFGVVRRGCFLKMELSRQTAAPSAQGANVVMEDEELLVQCHALPLPAELPEQVAETSTAGNIEAKGLGKVFLRVLGRVGAHEV